MSWFLKLDVVCTGIYESRYIEGGRDVVFPEAERIAHTHAQNVIT